MFTDELRDIIGSHARTLLNPVGFFVARSGVLTLAYEGFCNSVLDIKSRISEMDAGLAPEFDGSMWPKTSLAALRPGTRLGMQDIENLHSVCHSWDAYVREQATPLFISKMYLVQYSCRSLERVESELQLELNQARSEESDFLPAWHLKNVDDILAQFNINNLRSYAKQIQYSGNDENHYRQDANGTTLIVKVKPDQESLQFLEDFRSDVDKILPGRYAWFENDSLHVTVRNLFN